jgi:glycosyltransferase involved in cell wall biosynthesis
MRVEVTHVTPSAFGAGGLWGGGERYPLCLARAMSELVPTRLIVFGTHLARRRDGRLEICEIPTRMVWKGGSVNPVSERLGLYLPLTRRIHSHQYHSIVTNLLLMAGRAIGRQVYVTDHGGRSYEYADRYRLERLVSGFLPVSRFSADLLPQLAARASAPIFGGADPARFHPGEGERSRRVVYVGRLLPHKGIDVLIRALDESTPLRVYGRAYDVGYRSELARLATGKDVVFYENASDDEIAAAYRSARAVVLPSVHNASDGFHPWPELLGLTLIEAMASGTPVIASRVGGMREIVSHGETGYLVEPGDVEGLGARIGDLVDGGARWRSMSDRALASARAQFTWERVAERCLAAYDQFGG